MDLSYEGFKPRRLAALVSFPCAHGGRRACVSQVLGVPPQGAMRPVGDRGADGPGAGGGTLAGWHSSWGRMKSMFK